jgi:thymidylate synthase (FAD)
LATGHKVNFALLENPGRVTTKHAPFFKESIFMEITPTPLQAEVLAINPDRLDPLADGISSVELARSSGSDLDVVNAARVSYGKISTEMHDRNKKLIKYLLEHSHTSPFEHNQLSYRIKAPLYVARQWMRHRMNSYNEISYRYVQAPLEFYVPKEWRYQHSVNHQASVGAFNNESLVNDYKQAIEASMKIYQNMLDSGVCREQARGLLPMCTYTEFIFTCNLHSLMNFLRLRLHTGAQWEIRKYAEALLELALPHFPVSLGCWRELHHGQIELSEAQEKRLTS